MKIILDHIIRMKWWIILLIIIIVVIIAIYMYTSFFSNLDLSNTSDKLGVVPKTRLDALTPNLNTLKPKLRGLTKKRVTFSNNVYFNDGTVGSMKK